jgi:hypothetical protein
VKLTTASMMRLAVVAVSALTSPVLAQQAGWHYSPLAGEGDRAALGCAIGSTPQEFVCLAVRCEDDFTVGVHFYTSRPGGDAGRWRIDIDKEDGHEVEAKPDGSPYNARIEGDVAPLLEALKNGGLAYLDPKAGPDLPRNGITLDGSLYVINQALYFCAPRVPPVAASLGQ